jgi:hypothetical protein
MTRMFVNFFLFIIMMFIHFVAHAQNSVSISATNSIEMNFTPPTNPGNPISIIMDESKWLNYDITVIPPDPFVSITVQIASGTIPPGLQLQIQAGTFQGTGGGIPGTPSGKLTLSDVPQVLIGDIGTCNTGFGAYVGHQLTYTLSISDYSAAQSSLSGVEILFTITQTGNKSNLNNIPRQHTWPSRSAAPTRSFNRN